MIGDLPDAGARPEDNLIFVCKLNPVTTEEDLEIIFSRFGKVTCCDVVKDWKTGESLCYAFVGFETKEQAEQAYFKMDNVLIDDRRIHVDFYQSMYHQWRQHKRQEAGGRGTRGPGPARGAPLLVGRAPAQSWRQHGRLPPPQAPSRDRSRSPPTFRSPKGRGTRRRADATGGTGATITAGAAIGTGAAIAGGAGGGDPETRAEDDGDGGREGGLA